MVQLVIQVQPEAAESACALCGQWTLLAAGPQLATADGSGAVCRDCGRRHAPSLVSLLELAGAAQRAGHVGRHSLFPPMTSLLDLARAAEEYLHASPRGQIA